MWGIWLLHSMQPEEHHCLLEASPCWLSRRSTQSCAARSFCFPPSEGIYPTLLSGWWSFSRDPTWSYVSEPPPLELHGLPDPLHEYSPGSMGDREGVRTCIINKMYLHAYTHMQKHYWIMHKHDLTSKHTSWQLHIHVPIVMDYVIFDVVYII